MAVPFCRVLRKGSAGTDVQAIQRTLRQLDIRQSDPTGHYGEKTKEHVKEYQKKHKIRDDGVYGPKTHKLLAKRFDATAKDQYRTHTVIRNALYYVAHASQVHYVQTRPMQDLAPPPNLNTACDCSEFATMLFKQAGFPDPNGFDYNGWGFTGTMVNHGKKVSSISQAKPGRSLVFYGHGPGGMPTHVAVLITPTEVVSQGSEPGPFKLFWRYRSDVHSIRVYG